VLNTETGLVSPQFHVQHDSNFDTVKQLYSSTHVSQWQIKAGLTDPAVQGKEGGGNQIAEKTTIERRREVSEGAEPTTLDRNGTSRISAQPRRDRQPDDVTTSTPEGTTSRTRKPPERLIEVFTSEIQRDSGLRNEILSYQAMFPGNDHCYYEALLYAMKASADPDNLYLHEAHKQPVCNDHCYYEALLYAMTAKADPDILYLHGAQKQPDCNDHCYYEAFLYAMKASADPDTLYLRKALPDWTEFSDAMQLEIDRQVRHGIYTIVKRSEVPEGAKVLPSVWQLRHKRDKRTGKVKKHKARCNIDGSRMKEGRYYEETYAPVAGWTSTRPELDLILLSGWYAVQLDYVLAYSQTPTIRHSFMKINNRLGHFRIYVNRGIITIHPIKSEDQPADILTKPLNEISMRHKSAVYTSQRPNCSINMTLYQATCERECKNNHYERLFDIEEQCARHFTSEYRKHSITN
jgi:hypothetical protein